FESPPSVGEIAAAKEAWKTMPAKQKVPVEIIYAARKEFSNGDVPEEALGFLTGLLAALSKCYFSPRSGQVAQKPSDPFSIEKECSVCVYNGAVCSHGSVSKTRPFLAFEDAVKVRAYVYGRSPSDSDVYYVLPMVLQHRIRFGDNLSSNMFYNTLEIVKKYSDVAAKSESILQKIFEALNARDFNTLLSLRNAVGDRVELKALIDEFIEQKAAAFRAEGKPEGEDKLVGQDDFKTFSRGMSCFKVRQQPS
ncbi:MAG: hypothetical protein ACPL07_02250, partial [Candidatus Bathyarchaeia archaeon]